VGIIAKVFDNLADYSNGKRAPWIEAKNDNHTLVWIG